MRVTVVLAHGLLGIYNLVVSGGLGKQYFGGISEHLAKAGYDVIRPQVPAMGSIASRAACLAEKIESATDGPVVILAHSMGGLDSRHLISHLGFADRVIGLATISTPHRGSPVADWGVQRIGEELGGLGVLSALGVEHDGLAELTAEACSRFNKATPDHPGVVYVSVAGSLPRARISPLLKIPHAMIERAEGENDGLVSVSSAKWGHFLGLWPVDHLAEVNLPSGADLFGIDPPDPEPWYLNLVQAILRRSEHK